MQSKVVFADKQIKDAFDKLENSKTDLPKLINLSSDNIVCEVK